MAGRFRYHKDARQDIFEAVDWYENRSQGLGAKFADDLVGTLHKIAARPDTYRKVFKDFRKIAFSAFPYYIISRLRRKTVFVLAIFHDKRLDIWKERE
jgi:plasmid stabilization system protein ParE